MSFLAGRSAAMEGSFFLQESKLAAGRLSEKLSPSTSGEAAANSSTSIVEEPADVLPEILRHTIPIRVNAETAADRSLSTASKWLLKNPYPSPASTLSADALNPLRAYASIPQATFGPKRWELLNEQPSFSASTANELRRDRHPPISPEKLKALTTGYSQIGKAFAVATMIVFGGATALVVYTAHRLQIENTDHIRSKGRDLIQPRVEVIREQLIPLRFWVEHISKKWHVEGESRVKEKPVIRELSKVFSSSSKF
ncbi:hypothetical protein KSP39_PZI021113 [Platanthera zijinensis]|uniref:Uncharacterized protein n=1 Tax=Platanthera zijinensis TaxID=2320716 RepID=A0AAP0FV94_9ASPA